MENEVNKITAKITCDIVPAINELNLIEHLAASGVIIGINENKLSDYITDMICKSVKVVAI